MVLKTFKKFGGFYPPNTLWEVINLYFRGQNAHEVVITC